MKSFLLVSLATATVVLASHAAPGHHRRATTNQAVEAKLMKLLLKRQTAQPALRLAAANSTPDATTDGAVAPPPSPNPVANATLLAVKTLNPEYNTTGLWFKETGSQGACLKVNTDTDLVMGLSTAFWNDTGVVSPYCGKTVYLTNPSTGKNVTAIVADASGNNYTTLTIAAFEGLGGQLVNGEIEISFRFAGSTTSVPTQDTLAAANNLAATPNSSSSPSSSSSSTTSSSSSEVASSPSPSPSPTPTTADIAAAKASADAAAAASAASSSSAAAAAASSQAAVKLAADQAASEAAASSSAAAAAATRKAAAKQQAAADAAAAPAPPAPAPITSVVSDVGNFITGGSATYFYQNGVAGACGTVAQDSDYVIAIDSARYNGGANCNKKIQIIRISNGATVTATVRDECPTCNSGNSLDLSVGAFKQIATESEGLVAIKWQFV